MNLYRRSDRTLRKSATQVKTVMASPAKAGLRYSMRCIRATQVAPIASVIRVQPVAVAHDLHPGYLSTRIAQGMGGVARVGVQHHHAHIAACMAEHGMQSETIGTIVFTLRRILQLMLHASTALRACLRW